MGIANITIVGRLTRDPETRTIKTKHGESSVTSFAIAVNTKRGGEKKVSFFECQAFGGAGTTIESWCKKGNELTVAGQIDIEKWEDKDGNQRTTPKVTVRDFAFISSQQDDDAPKATSKPKKVEVQAADLPF